MRRSISVKGVTYDRLKTAKPAGVPMSYVVDDLIVRYLDQQDAQHCGIPRTTWIKGVDGLAHPHEVW